MHIICTTPQAAAEVIEILFSTGLHTVHDFTMRPILSTTPPLIFTMLIALTAAQVTKINTVADTTVVG